MAIDEFDPGMLSDLVDHRREEPDIEYKAWMPLSDNAAKAKIAKHICALANYGGGWLLFGVSDDGSHTEPHPGSLDEYKQDIINGICERYLTPAPHCQVLTARSRVTGKDYPVVRVPPHGTVPVCGKVDGPRVNNQITGIQLGTHYIRAQGPKSIAIDKPELWREVIHRCVINERDALLGSIGRLFDRPSVPAGPAALDALIEAASARWAQSVLAEGWPVDPKIHRVAFAYRILDAEGGPVAKASVSGLRGALRRASSESDAAMELGWSFFLQAGSETDAPKVIVEGDIEGLEADMVTQDGHYQSIPTLWRAMTDGTGFEVRTQPEDSEWVYSAINSRRTPGWSKGERISPSIQLKRTYQFVAFVHALANTLPDAAEIELAVDHSGLKNRFLDNGTAGSRLPHGKAAVDTRRLRVRSSVSALAGDGTFDATMRLVAPALLLFDGYELRHDTAWAFLLHNR